MVEGATAQSRQLECLKCGNEIRARLFFCPFCGTKIDVISIKLEVISDSKTSVSELQNPELAEMAVGQIPPIDFSDRLDDASAQVDLGRDGQRATGGNQSATIALEDKGDLDSLGGSGLPKSVDHPQMSFPERQAKRKRKWLALAAAIVLIAGAAIFLSSPQKEPAQLVPQEKPVVPSAKSPRDVAKVEDRATTVSLSNEWRRVTITVDPDRPVIALSAKRPFRVRVNGELYLVAASSAPEINFGNTSFIELRAVEGSTNVKITRSARAGMNDG